MKMHDELSEDVIDRFNKLIISWSTLNTWPVPYDSLIVLRLIISFPSLSTKLLYRSKSLCNLKISELKVGYNFYLENTVPVIEYFRNKGILIEFFSLNFIFSSPS